MVSLAAEAGCISLLKWRCDLPESLDVAAVALRLRERGFRARTFEDWLIVLEGPEGSEILLVPGTGRVQIRVGYMVPKPERPDRAGLVLAELERACVEAKDAAGALTPAPPGPLPPDYPIPAGPRPGRVRTTGGRAGGNVTGAASGGGPG